MNKVCVLSLSEIPIDLPGWVSQAEARWNRTIDLSLPQNRTIALSGPYDRVVVIGRSLSLNRENLSRVCHRYHFDPLRVHAYPMEGLTAMTPSQRLEQWENDFQTILSQPDPGQTGEVVSFQPEKKVLIIAPGEEERKAIADELAQLGIPSLSPTEPFSFARQGIQYEVMMEERRETVGAIAIAETNEKTFSFSISRETEETKKVIEWDDFQPRILMRSFRLQTVVFLVPEMVVPPEIWKKIFESARLLAERDGTRVLILCREVIVAGDHLEKAYRETREAGVLFEKIDFITLVLKPTLDMRGAWVDMTTERDGMSMTLHADWVVKVPGFHKIPTDFSHIFQADRIIQTVSRPENVNLPPFTLPYPGLFVIPGSRFLSNRSSALQEVAEYLQREILVEKGRALVDEEKCVLCLTCLRTCPWSAIDIEGNSRRKKARINWEQCHLCGLCLSSCPADAISLEGLTECYEIIQQ